jgi:hypothetical protein
LISRGAPLDARSWAHSCPWSDVLTEALLVRRREVGWVALALLRGVFSLCLSIRCKRSDKTINRGVFCTFICAVLGRASANLRLNFGKDIGEIFS